MPSSVLNCVEAMKIPAPAANPVTTDSKTKLTRKPRRNSHATANMVPTSTDVRATIVAYSPRLATSAPTPAATRIDSADVGPTMTYREVPRKTYVMVAKNPAYRPACGGKFASEA